MEFGLAKQLAADATVSGYVGSRILPVALLEGTALPAIVYSVTSASNKYALDNSACSTKRIDYNCFAADYPTASAIRTAVKAVLSGYRGTLADGTVVEGAYIGVEMDEYSDDSHLFRCLVEVEVMYNT